MSEAEAMSSDGVLIKPIGVMRTIFNKKNGTARQSFICPQSKGILTINKNVFSNGDHSLDGIQQFTHIWILYHFHANTNKRVHAKVHPPRLNGQSCGVFSTRSPHRPNPIGLTLAKLDSVVGDTLHVSGIDLLDESPVIDIKPYIRQYDCPQSSNTQTEQITCSSDSNLNSNSNTGIEVIADNCKTTPNWIAGSIVSNVSVDFTSRSLSQLSLFHAIDTQNKCNYCLQLLSGFEEAKQAIINLLEADPRSVYRRKKCIDRLYFFTIDSIHITSWFDLETNVVEVVKIKPFLKY